MSRVAWIAIGVAVAIVLGSRTVFAAKPGTTLSIRPEMVYARSVLAQLWIRLGHNDRLGYPLTVTSGYDGTHSATSKHYEGLAEDYRTRDLSPAQVKEFAALGQSLLGSAYDVVIEPDHLHTEYDPATA